MLILTLALLTQTAIADEMSLNGCRAGFSNAALKNIKSGYHAVQPSEDLARLDLIMVVTNKSNPETAAGRDRIYLSASAAQTAQNEKLLNTLAVQIEKRQITQLCVKAKDDWAKLDSELSLSFGREPNTYVIDTKQPLPL